VNYLVIISLLRHQYPQLWISWLIR